MTKPDLLISFSGGETSALMTKLCLGPWRNKWDQVVVLFANTGQENEQTLEFVRRCDEGFGFGTVWLEAVVNPEMRSAAGHRVVTFETASRDGRPFEDHIKKYGIPNAASPHCTRELKLRPIRSYMESIGWKDYETAIGIRADEVERRSPKQAQSRIVYPLIDFEPMSKPMVNAFWVKQPFRLELTGYQGNCRWCWKKSMRKLMTIMDETPEAFDFPERMEALYGEVGPEFKKEFREGYRRVFFRGGLSTKALRSLYEQNKHALDRADDDAIVMPERGLFDFDSDAGCVESCEVNFEDDA